MHPIIRTAVHDQLSTAARSAAHGRGARMLGDENASAERVAAHLLETEPCASDWACERLRDAARRALPSGAPDASVTYLRRALEEPPGPDSRPAVLLELGIAESLTLDREPVDAVFNNDLLTLNLPAGKYMIQGKLNVTQIQSQPFTCSLTTGAGSSFDETTLARTIVPNEQQFPRQTVHLTVLHPSTNSFTAHLRCNGFKWYGAAGAVAEDMKLTALQVDELQNTPG